MPRRRILCSGWEAAEKRRRRIVRQRLNEFDQLHPHPSEVVVEAAVAASGSTSAPFPNDATDLLDDSCIFSDNCDATSVQTVEVEAGRRWKWRQVFTIHEIKQTY